ncbi:MAG: pyridoxamine 5'-phosphate oxidase family protein, partial [Desulfobacterales bacterium]|nr:pyridoxamine 5'-phosphate oxidase family protein [Desulfobacterales bacterium]
MNDNNEAVNIRGILEHLLKSQNLAVLATQNHGQPYTSLVAFAGSEELKALYFVTGQATRKYANLTGDPRAAMMIDNRSNAPADIADAMAATATGSVDMLSENEQVTLLNIYLQKHPHL